MKNKKSRRSKWLIRKQRVRKTISGSAERPRMNIFRSLHHIYAQVIDDAEGRTLLAVSTLDKSIRDQAKGQKPREAAALVGELVAQRCKEKGIEKVVFDRSGYRYHGRVLELAEAARKAGLDF